MMPAGRAATIHWFSRIAAIFVTCVGTGFVSFSFPNLRGQMTAVERMVRNETKVEGLESATVRAIAERTLIISRLDDQEKRISQAEGGIKAVGLILVILQCAQFVTAFKTRPVRQETRLVDVSTK